MLYFNGSDPTVAVADRLLEMAGSVLIQVMSKLLAQEQLVQVTPPQASKGKQIDRYKVEEILLTLDSGQGALCVSVVVRPCALRIHAQWVVCQDSKETSFDKALSENGFHKSFKPTVQEESPITAVGSEHAQWQFLRS